MSTINDTATTIDETSYICVLCHDEVATTYTMMDAGHGIAVCGDCARIYGINCSDCGILHHYDDTVDIGNNIFVCADCLHENYRYCPRCERHVCSDAYNVFAGVCEDCSAEAEAEADCDGLLHPYSYSPNLLFFRGGGQSAEKQLYFGVELEYHCADRAHRYDVVTRWSDDHSNAAHWYAKEDSSLRHGVEFVSHPHTLQAWVEQYDAVAACMGRALRYGAYCNDDSGLHIHISKTGMTDAHKARFAAFVHLNADHLEHIARRGESSWATFRTKKASTYYADGRRGQYNRYEAVNWKPERTVELRFFKSTLSVTAFFAALEFAHAAYQFTKYGAVGMSHICHAEAHGWVLFLDFIASSRQYPTLRQMAKDGLI